MPVLLVGTYRPAVAAARALARRGRRVLVGTCPDRENIEGSGGVELSRHVDGQVPLPDHRADPDGWLRAIAAEAGRHREPLRVLPFYEPTVALLSSRRASLDSTIRL